MMQGSAEAQQPFIQLAEDDQASLRPSRPRIYRALGALVLGATVLVAILFVTKTKTSLNVTQLSLYDGWSQSSCGGTALTISGTPYPIRNGQRYDYTVTMQLPAGVQANQVTVETASTLYTACAWYIPSAVCPSKLSNVDYKNLCSLTSLVSTIPSNYRSQISLSLSAQDSRGNAIANVCGTTTSGPTTIKRHATGDLEIPYPGGLDWIGSGSVTVTVKHWGTVLSCKRLVIS